MARESGQSKLSRTALVKFLYLLDVFFAEESRGKRFTEFDWRFLHFGPFAYEAVNSIETLGKNKQINKEEIQNEEMEGSLYSLPDWTNPKPLETLGVPSGAKVQLAQVMKTYAYDLPGLLNYVYFRTSPMEGALPGQRLSFDGCKKLDHGDIRPVRLKALPDVKRKRLVELFNRLEQNHKSESAKSTQTGPIMDDYYLIAVNDSDSLEDQKGDVVKAKLSFDKP